MRNEPRNNPRPGLVPFVPPLGFGTVGQNTKANENSGTSGGTTDLKALAGLVLARDKAWDNRGTAPQNLVPHGINAVGQAWDKNDWLAFYHERAGIAEHDGSLPRTDAEHMAYEHCVVRWMNENPSSHTDPHTCPQCSKATDDKSIAVLNAKGGHLWLHDKCHTGWLAHRRQEAAKALAVMGICP